MIETADRERPCLCRRRPCAVRRALDARLRPPVAPLARRADRRRARRRRALQARPGRLRAVEAVRPTSEPGWDSPWGRGRPGWHIECSAMSEQHLGETFDIHGGGLDLDLPAPRERDRAEPLRPSAPHAWRTYWMHNGFLTGRRREDVEVARQLLHRATSCWTTDKFGGRKWPGEVLRLAMLKTHYRQPIDWTVEGLNESAGTLDDWFHLAAPSQLRRAFISCCRRAVGRPQHAQDDR